MRKATFRTSVAKSTGAVKSRVQVIEGAISGHAIVNVGGKATVVKPTKWSPEKIMPVVKPTNLAENAANGASTTNKKNHAARKRAREAATRNELERTETPSNDVNGSSTDSPRAADEGRQVSPEQFEDAEGRDSKPKPTEGESESETNLLGKLRKSQEDWSRRNNRGNCTAVGAVRKQVEGLLVAGVKRDIEPNFSDATEMLLHTLRSQAKENVELAEAMVAAGIPLCVMESDMEQGDQEVMLNDWVDVEFEVALDSGSIVHVCRRLGLSWI